ncbi:MAG: TerC family protein [Firmicutes bacterium]|nr:TerC family protein [Bacillota bacterium]
MEHIGGVTLADLGTSIFWVGVLSIILIDLVLSGDNAVLIALACRNLPPKLQKKGIMFGMAGAVGLRVLLASVMVYLLEIPFLKAAGGLLLAWIAVKLVLQEEEGGQDVEAPEKLWAAVKTIIIADAVMSTDNILAVAGAAQGKAALLWFGLVVSIPLVVFGSQILVVLMNRFPWIIALGAAVLGWTSGHMIITDTRIEKQFGVIIHSPYTIDGYLFPALGALGVVAVGMLMKKRSQAKEISDDNGLSPEAQGSDS